MIAAVALKIKETMQNVLSILGVLIGLAGLLASAYFYRVSRRIRNPTFIPDSSRIQILSSRQVADVPIKVIRKDGGEVNDDLTAVRFYFWNRGTKSIRNDSILEPVRIRLNDINAQIIDAKLLRSSRDITKLELLAAPDDPKRALLLNFLILEHNDGATGQIIYEGNPNAGLTISGIVEEVDHINTEADITAVTMFLRNKLSWVIIVCVIVVFLVTILFEYWVQSFIHRFGSVPMVTRVFTYALPSFALLYAAFAFGGWFHLCRNAAKSPSRLVPDSVLPEHESSDVRESTT